MTSALGRLVDGTWERSTRRTSQERLLACVMTADSSKSAAPTHSNPAISNPSVRPPAPQNRSNSVGLPCKVMSASLAFIEVCAGDRRFLRRRQRSPPTLVFDHFQRVPRRTSHEKTSSLKSLCLRCREPSSLRLRQLRQPLRFIHASGPGTAGLRWRWMGIITWCTIRTIGI